MKLRTNHRNIKQQGIALPVVMILLLLAGLAALYTARTSIKEQKVTADQYRSEQAFSGAQAGVEAAVALHNSFDRDVNPVLPDPINSIPTGWYKVMFCDIWDDDDNSASEDTNNNLVTGDSLMAAFVRDSDSCTNPLNIESYGDGFADDARVGVISVGKPDDRSGVRVISVVSAPGLKINNGTFDFVPLSAKGSVSITGNITVVNRQSNINVWSGLSTGSGSNSVESYISDPDNPASTRAELISTDYPDPPNAVLASKQDLGKNSDILDNDINLKKLSDDEMILRLFSSGKNTLRAMADGIGQHYTTGTVEDELKDVNELQDTDNLEIGLMWLDYSGNSPVTLNVGTENKAAFLIVEVDDGDTLIINGGTIYGMVFVIGKVEGGGHAQLGGNVAIIGSMISTGNVDKSGGTPMIVYDKDGLEFDPEGLAGLRGIEPGTWQDWRWDDGS